MNTCPVIRIASAQHNESDFDPEIHTIFEPKKLRKTAENPAQKSVQAAEK